MILRRCYGLKTSFNLLRESGTINFDKSQDTAIEHLSKLSEKLESSNSIWSGFTIDKPKSLYLFGSVGSGKTMLMDFFYDNLRIEKKARYHFNQFMLQFHLRVKDTKCEIHDSPINEFISEYCKSVKLICLDEFQVTDIADAMILRTLLSGFLSKGMTIVTTSNRPPDDLYLNGIQRSSFLPCIDLIKNSFNLIDLTSKRDYRLNVEIKSCSEERFFDSISGIVDELFRTHCHESGSIELNVIGRNLRISNGKLGDCVKFDFKELFEENKSPADYIEICKSFKSIYVTKIPKFTLENRNEIRRLISFLDQAYESRVKLYCESEGNIIENLKHIKAELNPQFDETFALSRTISRLEEMRKREYK